MYLFKVSVIFFLMIAATACFAQDNDYLVTAKNDTLRGKIKILSFDTDQAQVNVDGKKKMYPAYTIKTLRVKGTIYASQKRLDQYRIMKLIKSGYLSIYGFREPNQPAYDGRMLVKKDGSSLEVPNLSFKKLMSLFLEDCGEVANGIRAGSYLKKDLESIVDQYNGCIDSNTKARYAEVATKTVSPVTNARLDALTALEKKVNDLPDFENKKNAQDLISDIKGKVKAGSPVQPYLLEGLKGYLGKNEMVEQELQKVLSSLGGN